MAEPGTGGEQPEPEPEPAADAAGPGAPSSEVEQLVPVERLLAVADGPPLAPDEPDSAARGPLLPLELLAWDGEGELVGVRCTTGEVVLRRGRPATRRTLAVKRLTRWARAGRLTLHGGEGVADVELRLLAPGEYSGLSLGDPRPTRVAGPVRMARSGQLSSQRDEVSRTLVSRVVRVSPDVQVGNG